MMKVLTISKQLFLDFNDNEIIYCHWKSNEHLLEGLAGQTDLDVLVDKKQKDLTSRILETDGYIKLNPQYGSRYPDVEDWVACDEENKALIHIHLHYELITGHAGLKEYNLPWTDIALSTRKYNKEYQIYVTDPNLEIIILLTRIGLKSTLKTKIKALVGRYALNLDDIKEIRYLNELIDRHVVSSIAEPYYGNQTGDLLSLIDYKKYNSEWISRLIHITNRNARRYCRYTYIKSLLLRAYYSVTLLMRRVLKKVFKVRLISKKCLPIGSNISIAIIGQDGAGKSTVVKEVASWLLWKLDVQQYYMGCGDGYNSIVKKIMNYFSNRMNSKLLVPILSIINYVQVARYVKRSIKSSQKFSRKGSIVLFDRYPQTKYYGISDGPKIRQLISQHKLPNIIRKVILRIAKYEEECYAYAVGYAPSTVIKLVLPPEISIKRKPNERIDDVEKKYFVISSLTFPQSDVLTIDATMDYEHEICMIRGSVWNKIIQTIKNNQRNIKPEDENK